MCPVRLLYLQHGLSDAIGLDEPVLRKVGDEALIARTRAAPRHGQCSVVVGKVGGRRGSTAGVSGELRKERQSGERHGD